VVGTAPLPPPFLPTSIFHLRRRHFGCIEEAAYYSKFIDREQLLKLAAKLEKSGYGEYLKRVAK
jgi:dTDP-glucose pyrophosphorylase